MQDVDLSGPLRIVRKPEHCSDDFVRSSVSPWDLLK
jgi:hypothetical protein